MTNVIIEMENGGVMKGELYPEIAPETVANFVKLAKNGFYNGTGETALGGTVQLYHFPRLADT